MYYMMLGGLLSWDIAFFRWSGCERMAFEAHYDDVNEHGSCLGFDVLCAYFQTAAVCKRSCFREHESTTPFLQEYMLL